jgi:hypothetical protein
MTDLSVEGEFRWVAGPEDGELASLERVFWTANNPDDYDSNEDCVWLGGDFLFNDADCTYTSVYLVEYGSGMSAMV